jgi:membrane-associated phospholipid phosphatase
VSGLVATSRIKLKAHTPAQVYTGFLTGLIVVSFFLLFI